MKEEEECDSRRDEHDNHDSNDISGRGRGGEIYPPGFGFGNMWAYSS